MKPPGFNDLVVIGRITGAALLVCGYLLAGLYAGRWLAARGYPGWTVPLSLLCGLAAALFAGWRELKGILEFVRRGR